MSQRVRKNLIKTTTKQLDVGKWRMGVNEPVVGVRLRGMRNRTHPLLAVPKEQFTARLMKRPNGEIVDPAVLRGVPSTYYQEGMFLMIWPSPAHTWTIEIDTIKKEKAA